jgi:hypothetical protein
MPCFRRSLIRAVGAGSTVTWAGPTLPSVRAASADDATEWPQFKRDARNTGYATDTSVPTDGVETKWRYSVDRAIQSAPASPTSSGPR